jgi:hypothetical protein
VNLRRLLGSGVAAAAVLSLSLSAAGSTAAPAIPYIPTLAAGSTCSSGVLEDTCPNIDYFTGSWASAPCTHAGCSANHTEMASSSRGGLADLDFSGTRVVWKGSKGPKGGKAAVFIDGVRDTTVNLYRGTVVSGLALYTSPVLTRTSHILDIKLTLNKRVNIDDFIVSP